MSIELMFSCLTREREKVNESGAKQEKIYFTSLDTQTSKSLFNYFIYTVIIYYYRLGSLLCMQMWFFFLSFHWSSHNFRSAFVLIVDQLSKSFDLCLSHRFKMILASKILVCVSTTTVNDEHKLITRDYGRTINTDYLTFWQHIARFIQGAYRVQSMWAHMQLYCCAMTAIVLCL